MRPAKLISSVAIGLALVIAAAGDARAATPAYRCTNAETASVLENIWRAGEPQAFYDRLNVEIAGGNCVLAASSGERSGVTVQSGPSRADDRNPLWTFFRPVR